jgi:hypothetical protein
MRHGTALSDPAFPTVWHQNSDLISQSSKNTWIYSLLPQVGAHAFGQLHL